MSVTHVYAPSQDVRQLLKTMRVYPEPALRVEDLTSPTQALMVLDCFWHADPRVARLPNPVIVVHTQHNCIEKLIA